MSVFTESDLTPWFDPSEVSPTVPGVYEVIYLSFGNPSLAYWNGSNWEPSYSFGGKLYEHFQECHINASMHLSADVVAKDHYKAWRGLNRPMPDERYVYEERKSS